MHPRRDGEHEWTLEAISVLARSHDADRAVIAPGKDDSDHATEIVRCARVLGLHVSVLPRMFEAMGPSVEFDQVDGVTVLRAPG